MIWPGFSRRNRTRLRSAANQHVLRVALWGDAGAGKDTWAATLPLAGEQSGLILRPFDALTANWLADTRTRMALGHFPGATPAPTSTRELTHLSFILAQAGAGRFAQQRTVIVQMPQVAGSWWTDPAALRALHPEQPDPYQYLALSAGIICLLDPSAPDLSATASSLLTMLDHLDLARRQVRRRQPVRIALWLTKMDDPRHSAYWSDVASYAGVLFGSRLPPALDRLGRSGDYRFRWGACSAVGTVLHGGRVRSNAYWDYSNGGLADRPQPRRRILDPRAIHPVGVLDPVQWVLEPLLPRPVLL